MRPIAKTLQSCALTPALIFEHMHCNLNLSRCILDANIHINWTDFTLTVRYYMSHVVIIIIIIIILISIIIIVIILLLLLIFFYYYDYFYEIVLYIFIIIIIFPQIRSVATAGLRSLHILFDEIIHGQLSYSLIITRVCSHVLKWDYSGRRGR